MSLLLFLPNGPPFEFWSCIGLPFTVDKSCAVHRQVNKGEVEIPPDLTFVECEGKGEL